MASYIFLYKMASRRDPVRIQLLKYMNKWSRTYLFGQTRTGTGEHKERKILQRVKIDIADRKKKYKRRFKINNENTKQN